MSRMGFEPMLYDQVFFIVLIKKITQKRKIKCQEWDSNPCPFGPVPETGALDQLGHLDMCY